MEKTSESRAEDRSTWPLRKYRLGEEPSEDLSATTTPAERLLMMWDLSIQAWLLSGRKLPEYERQTAPGQVLRK